MPEYNPAVYWTPDWIKSIEYTREWNERALYAVMAILGKPKSFLDIGCGDGSLVAMMSGRMEGWSAGIEISGGRKQSANVAAADLRESVDLEQQFDLVVSWEVGEHLPAESANVYCDNVARHVGNWLIFTAAHPNQGGNYHINERSKRYWRRKFRDRGLIYEGHHTAHLREAWKWATGPCWWLPKNVQVFQREDHG